MRKLLTLMCMSTCLSKLEFVVNYLYGNLLKFPFFENSFNNFSRDSFKNSRILADPEIQNPNYDQKRNRNENEMKTENKE